MPKVSIIVPVYNSEHFIEQCIRSILAQTLQDIEIIIINDGCTDKTPEIIKKLIKDHTNATMYEQENKGLYQTRKRGLSLATGDYIGWVDADDFVEPDMYEVLYSTAIENNSELVLCDYKFFPEKFKIKEKWFRPYQGTINTTFVERNSQPWNKIVKRELLERLNVGAYFETCFDEIYIQVLMQAKNPISVEKELYYYRVSNGTMSSSFTNVAHYRQYVIASKNLKNIMKPLLNESYWKDYFDYRIIYYLLITMIVAANSGDRNEYNQNRMELLAIDPEYASNQHFWKILRENYGKLKAAVIGRVVPIGYWFAYLACKVGIR